MINQSFVLTNNKKCGWDPTKVRTAKISAWAALGRATEILAVGFVGGLFWLLFWPNKKVTRAKRCDVETVMTKNRKRKQEVLIRKESSIKEAWFNPKI